MPAFSTNRDAAVVGFSVCPVALPGNFEVCLSMSRTRWERAQRPGRSTRNMLIGSTFRRAGNRATAQIAAKSPSCQGRLKVDPLSLNLEPKRRAFLSLAGGAPSPFANAAVGPPLAVQRVSTGHPTPRPGPSAPAWPRSALLRARVPQPPPASSVSLDSTGWLNPADHHDPRAQRSLSTSTLDSREER
jgi:hypothetical protein